MAKRQARPAKATRSAATGRKRTSGGTKKVTGRGRKQTAKRAKTTVAAGRKRASRAQAKTKRTPQRATKRAVKASRKSTRAVAKTTTRMAPPASVAKKSAPQVGRAAARPVGGTPERQSLRTASVMPAPAGARSAREARAGSEGLDARAARQGGAGSTRVAPDATPRGPAPAPEPRSRRVRTRGGAPLPAVTPEMVGAHDEESPEEPLVPTPTSFDLDLRRTRTANVSLEERFDPDPQSALAVAAGDHDVSPESAEAVGDETPGGDNPTPDMDVVDLIGRSLGVEYEDNEELKGVDKITARDRKRWELDPASAEDFKERNRS